MFNNVLSVVQIFLEKMAGFVTRNPIKGGKTKYLISIVFSTLIDFRSSSIPLLALFQITEEESRYVLLEE